MTVDELKYLFQQLGSKNFEVRDTDHGKFLTTNCPLAAIAGNHKNDFDYTPALSVSLRGQHYCVCFACGFRGSLSWLGKTLDDNGLVPDDVLTTIRDATKSDGPRAFVAKLGFVQGKSLVVTDLADQLLLSATPLNEAQFAWLEAKGCTAATAKKWGVCGGGHKNILFPVRSTNPRTNKEIIAGVWARNPWPSENQRTKYWALFPFRADQYVYGENSWKKGLPMVVFEGMLDVLHADSLGLTDVYNLCAVQRSNLSSANHLFKIINSRPSIIYVFGDDDAPGWIGATRSKKRLDRLHPDVRAVVAFKDPKTLTHTEITTVLESAPKRGLNSIKTNLRTLKDFNLKLYEE